MISHIYVRCIINACHTERVCVQDTLMHSSFPPVTNQYPLSSETLRRVVIEERAMPLCPDQDAVQSNDADKRWCNALIIKFAPPKNTSSTP